MLNLKPFDKARSCIPVTEMPFLINQARSAALHKPYQNLRILQSIPLSIESICKLEPLVLGGASVTITPNKSIKPASQGAAIELAKAIGITFCPDHNFNAEFDFVLDCGGELAGILNPKRGIVEITQTGSEIYKEQEHTLAVPMISVDDSKLKELETFYGTGEACVRALRELTGKPLKNLNFVVFGFGKVGSGAAHFLTKESPYVTIIDTDASKITSALTQGLVALHPQKDHAEVEKALLEAHFIITATGVKNLLSTHFPKHLFEGKVLANLGVEDEFGPHFSEDEVLHAKQPINFSLADPTLMRYLDPILYAHNLAIDLIETRSLRAGYHPFPQDVDAAIMQQWHSYFLP